MNGVTPQIFHLQDELICYLLQEHPPTCPTAQVISTKFIEIDIVKST